MKPHIKKPTPTEKLKAEITALRQDIYDLVMEKSFTKMTETSLRWKTIFQGEELLMSGSHTGLCNGKIQIGTGLFTKIKSKGSKNKVSNLKVIKRK